MNHQHRMLLATALFVCVNAFAQRKQLGFDQNWKFALGHAANPEKDFNYGIKTVYSKTGGVAGTAMDAHFDDTKWRTLNLPHDWAVELPFAKVDNFDVESHGYKPVGGLFPETSIGWYRKHFTIPATDSGRQFQLQFDGIFRDAKVWVNGVFMGSNASGYLGCSFNITDVVNFDKDNVVVVRVDATQYEGWFYEGAGIYRHVWLNSFNNAHVVQDGVFATATMGNGNAAVRVETTLQNLGITFRPLTLHCFVADRAGKIVANAKPVSVQFSGVATTSVAQTATVPMPTLWQLDYPYLYRVVVQLKDGNNIVDEQRVRFGIRTIEVKNNGVFLNGQAVKLLGTNNHQDHAGLGSALPDYLQYYRIGLLKSMGSNAYRTSHHAPTPELLDACDSLGILVMDEQRLLNSGPEYMQQLERLVKRDRNHASVFMWSIGNEEGWVHTTSTGKRMAQTLMAKLKDLDPTRTCTYAADLANVHRGVNEVIPVRGFNYRQFAVADYHNDHPNQPIIGTEMGSTVTTRGIWEKDSIRAYLPDQDITAPWWASTAETWWKLAAPNDFWLGGFIWTGFDYRGEPTPFKWPNINSHFGIMDMCGFPKNIYYYYQSWWTNKDVLHISPHWNHGPAWGENAGKPIDVWVNSNADDVELFLNGKSQGKKAMPRNGHLKWSVNYAPGALEAIAYKSGKRLTQKVETTDVPFEVVMTPYKTTMLADGQDATVVNITVVDRAGREVPDADNMIRFYLQGDAKIIGVGNGDPSSHEPDKCAEGAWQRSLFNGKCQVIIQSGQQPGMFKLEAKAANLLPGSTDVVMVAPANIAAITMDEKYALKGEAAKPRTTGKMLGADISFLPQLEAQGIKFSDKGVEKDAIEILKDHGFNYVRLRIFNNPTHDSGYSPKKGFCDLENTKKMAKRVKALGMKLLLDFHYSDTWADPGKQYKPLAWKGLAFTELKQALYDYTKTVMEALKVQGTLPDMVQVGNEINHGIAWPDGSVMNIDGTAQLIQAGTAAVKAVAPETIMMLHVALGGQHDESAFFIDNMVSRGVPFDVIGQSYYPKWHGTLTNLEDNLNKLATRYNKDVIVVEYSALKQEVNKIAFEVANGRGKGTCIWEPLSTWEKIFDIDGKANAYLLMYDDLSKKFVLQ